MRDQAIVTGPLGTSTLPAEREIPGKSGTLGESRDSRLD